MLRLTKLDEGQVCQRGASLGYATITTCGDLTGASERAVLLQAVRSINEHIDEVAVAAAPAVWTTADLRERICDGYVGRGLLLDEFLRRERERCAAVCDNAALGLVGHASPLYDVDTVLEQAASRIRELT